MLGFFCECFTLVETIVYGFQLDLVIMRISFIIFSVFVVLIVWFITVPGHEFTKVPGPIKAKWQQFRSKGGGEGHQNGRLKTAALKMANGVKSNVLRQAKKLAAAARGLPGANIWKFRKTPVNDFYNKKFKAMEDRMLSYFATDPDPFMFQLELYNFAVAKANRKPGNDKPDIPETVGLRTDPTQKIDPTDDYEQNHACNKICLRVYGYVFKPIPEKGGTKSERARFADGTVTPVTQGRVKYNWWSGTKQFMRNCKYDPYRCTCETKDDFLKLLEEFNIDPKPFEFFKKLSSIYAIKYLLVVLENTGGSLQWLNHRKFAQLLMNELMVPKLSTWPEMKTKSERAEEFWETAGVDTEEADDKYLEEMTFYRPPKQESTVNLPSPSVVAKLRDEGKLKVLQ